MSVLTHAITLTTSDGQAFPFSCGEDESILDAAARSGLTLPSACRQGACGACLAMTTEQAFRRGAHNEKALPQSAEQTPLLLCSTYPTGTLSVSVTATSAQITSGPVPQRTARVVANEDMGGEVRRLELEIIPDPIEGVGAPFEAGQFMELEIPGTGVWRAYSLSNAPNWEGRLEFLIRLQPQGQFSAWLSGGCSVGQEIQVKGPQGAMILNSSSLNARSFIAGGTGLAPMVSMLRQMAEFGESQACHLYFGVTRLDQLFCLSEIDALKASLPQLKVTVCLWEAPEGWDGFSGSPADAWEQDAKASSAKPDVYVCGPAGLIDAVEAKAQALGIAAGQVISERFLPSS